jgi:hypothetical protein
MKDKLKSLITLNLNKIPLPYRVLVKTFLPQLYTQIDSFTDNEIIQIIYEIEDQIKNLKENLNGNT